MAPSILADEEINWFDEGQEILAGRIRQINTGIHWPEEPVSRFEHIVTNVEVAGVEGNEILVNSKVFCYQALAPLLFVDEAPPE